MTDEQTGSAGMDDEQAEAAGKQPKSFSRRANNSLRSARRTIEGSEASPEERARHLIAEANALALLELAEAIRASKA